MKQLNKKNNGRLAQALKLGGKSAKITPIDRQVIWNHYDNCRNVRSAWVLASGKTGEQTEKNLFGVQLCKFEGLYRLNICGETLPLQNCKGDTSADANDWELHNQAMTSAVNDFSEKTKSLSPEHFEYWDWGILSSSEDFLAGIAEAMKLNMDYYILGSEGSKLFLKYFYKITLVMITPEDEAQILSKDTSNVSLKN